MTFIASTYYTLLSFQVLEQDFIPETPAAQLKRMQVKELNKVLVDLRKNIADMELDPLKLKQDLDNYKRENDALRAERDELLARLEQNNQINVQHEVQVDHVGQVGQKEEVVVPQKEEVVGPEGEQQLLEEVVVGNQREAIGCEIDYDDFQLFLKFKKFLTSERELEMQESGDPQKANIMQPVGDATAQTITIQTAKEDKSGGPSSNPIVTYPDGRVYEIIDVAKV